jgi:acetyl/propionyl-CoA carboxylase alpha subunit/acetyl-CoA carboxylase carboxyltransferase component
MPGERQPTTPTTPTTRPTCSSTTSPAGGSPSLPRRLLVANRGEIAVRILRAATDLGLETVAVHSTDDADALHVRLADRVVAIPTAGARAYLDAERLVAAALDTGCDAVHPGYGFLSERADFARACLAAGLTFVGPRPGVLELLGDKVAARRAAREAGVPVLAGTDGAVDLDAARSFLADLLTTRPGAAVMVKAVAGGGGRGMRVVRGIDELEAAFSRCASEAAAAFGDGALYLEELVPAARHIEVQVVGDGAGGVAQLGERDCSIQRRHQKVVEIAPAPGLSEGLRSRIVEAAVRLARSIAYDNVGTVEFLVDASGDPATLGPDRTFAFLEANARLQVEHTITEEVTGVDLVEAQLRLAGGATLEELGLAPGGEPAARGHALQLRLNLETIGPDGATRPSGGTLAVFDLPSGRGLRVDTFGYTGYRTAVSFDSLLAKLVVHRPSGRFEDLVAKAYAALCECRIEGVPSNIGFLQNLLRLPDFRAGRLTTGFVDDHLPELAAEGGGAAEPVGAGAGRAEPHPKRYVTVETPTASPAQLGGIATGSPAAAAARTGRAGAVVERADPLAVLTYGKAATARTADAAPEIATVEQGAVLAPMQGTIVSLAVVEGDTVRAGQLLLVMESMKMEHEIRADGGGRVGRILVEAGDAVFAGVPLLVLEPADVDHAEAAEAEEVDLDHIRPDLAEVLDRRRFTLDEHRPVAVARRRATGQRTARENVEDLCDPGTFVEYGPLVVAAQKRRRTMEDLLVRSPADGMITGIGQVNGEVFGDPISRTAVLAYDYTVFAGTQGVKNHQKTDRLIDVARQGRLPLVLFAEGGGGRPGDTDGGDQGTHTFANFATLSGLVPLVGITSGFCYAGNASLLGCCDVIIATEGSNIGMGGPAMIEGGGLGVFAPEEVGPLSVQVPSGVVDVVVADEAAAVATAKRYLSFFQGRLPTWEEPDQRRMRTLIPENRLRVYDVRRIVHTLADEGSVLELRPGFGVGMITALVRVEGRPLGIIANNPHHLGGAIDSDGSDKGARFMQLCDAFDIPLLYLCDTPGIMVGPEVERTALVRHSSRMFLVGANLSVPFFTIVLRKAYGLGCIAMAGGSFKSPAFTVAWPTGEFGGMGLEGAVKLGFRDQLAAVDDPAERLALYEKMVARAYERGKALRYATGFAIDDTIDPAESRYWVANLLASLRPPAPREGKKRPQIDAW